MKKDIANWYKNKRVFVTGHTGFKGAWLCKILTMFGAQVTGYALVPPTEPSLFRILGLEKDIKSVQGDIRDFAQLQKVMQEVQPEVVFHLAAQPIVRESYKEPMYTYETNVMGTVHICEAVRQTGSVISFVNVTTDKVYKNNEVERGYREEDYLDGYDPYSNSKSCSELVTHSYVNSFLREKKIAVSTARAGNVIGGGDFAVDRILPDCVRAAERGEKILIRNPRSVRPFQHVLEPLLVYLMIAKCQVENKALAGSYNVGPEEEDCICAGEVAELFCTYWNKIHDAEKSAEEKLCWVDGAEKNAPHEAGLLKLDCTKLKETFGWRRVWPVEDAIEKTVEWYKAYLAGADMDVFTKEQIRNFFGI